MGSRIRKSGCGVGNPCVPERYQCDWTTGLTPYRSIVAVPGLGTEAELTFRTKTQNGVISGDVWLRDYLPNRVGNARVLLYGYESSVRGSDSAATFHDMASTLLNYLRWIRKQTKVSQTALQA